MGMWDNVLLALQALKANKMRALLTMLGIIIGIGSVIAIITVGDSLTGTITDAMQGLGTSNITVTVTARDEDDEDTTAGLSSNMSIRSFVSSEPSESDLITNEMIDELKKDLGDRIDYISIAESIGTATVTIDGKTDSLKSTTTGVSEDYKDVNDLNMLYGRFVSEEDDTRRVCVVSDYLVNYLYGPMTDGVGKAINLNISGRVITFYICGVYEYESSSLTSMFSSSSTENTPIYTNLSVAKQINHSNKGYQTFTVVAKPTENATELLEVVEDYFQSFYTHNASYTVVCSNMEEMVEEVEDMLGKVSIAIAAIAAISLLVGGIGVMNIMLVSITERTREIGTRKALGAPNTAIRLQFITESVVICLVGGIIGIILGILLADFATNLLGYAAKPTISAIAIACGFSMLIGVFFGYYPANKAAKLDPIDALRYE